MIKAILLDWDGTLWDVLGFMMETYTEIFKHFKLRPWTREEYQERFRHDWRDMLDDMGLTEHADFLISYWEKRIATERPLAYGWVTDIPPPSIPGMTWRSGRLLGLLSVLGLFHPLNGVFGNPADLSLLLIGGRQSELSVAARLLARLVKRLILACPAENFRNRLAVQILTESGLAVTTPADTPSAGWEIAVDFRPFPPLVVIEGKNHYARPLFPIPLRQVAGLPLTAGYEHPVWAECQLACMSLPGAPPLPDVLSVEAVLTTQCLAKQAGLGFTLA